jgi:hypothetical protein
VEQQALEDSVDEQMISSKLANWQHSFTLLGAA